MKHYICNQCGIYHQESTRPKACMLLATIANALLNSGSVFDASVLATLEACSRKDEDVE